MGEGMTVFRFKDMPGRVYLNPGGGPEEEYLLDARSLNKIKQIYGHLTSGATIAFFSDDASDQNVVDNLLFEGTIHHDAVHNRWFAKVNWDSFRHESEEQ
jgi:hypothetical protein